MKNPKTTIIGFLLTVLGMVVIFLDEGQNVSTTTIGSAVVLAGLGLVGAKDGGRR